MHRQLQLIVNSFCIIKNVYHVVFFYLRCDYRLLRVRAARHKETSFSHLQFMAQGIPDLTMLASLRSHYGSNLLHLTKNNDSFRLFKLIIRTYNHTLNGNAARHRDRGLRATDARRAAMAPFVRPMNNTQFVTRTFANQGRVAVLVIKI